MGPTGRKDERREMINKISEVYAILQDTPPPFCEGTHSVTEEMCTIHYLSEDGLMEINLSNATETELEHLTRACKPAPFGRNDEDVYDESYRKARKMDTGDFITRFDVDDTDILRVIESKLVQFGNENRKIEPQLYKLNVYGKGSFFKSHKDTPRSDRMFGSLVVVFPTAHEGGVLALRHHDKTWEINPSAMLAKAEETPSVAYAAFYSDIDHEVREVTSGYRITLTYNLLFASSTSPQVGSIRDSSDTEPFGDKLLKLIDAIDEVAAMNLFRRGGYLAFGLLYQYPVSERGSVASLRTCLKGQDAALGSLLTDIGYEKWDLRVFYQQKKAWGGEPKFFFSDFVLQIAPYANVFEFDHLLPDMEYVFVIPESPFKIISSADLKYFHEDDEDRDYVGRKLVPLTPLPRFPHPPSKFIEYGNQAIAGKLYADICLVVELPAVIPGTERPPVRATLEAREEDLSDSNDSEGGEDNASEGSE